MTRSTPVGIGPAPDAERDHLTLEVVEERLDVVKRRSARGVVRVTTTTDVVQEVAEVSLDSYRVEITHVPVGRVVTEAPLARAEGDTTIVPVIEERFVVVKQLFLREELHIRHMVEREVRREPVTLRRQRATVDRRGIQEPDPADGGGPDSGPDVGTKTAPHRDGADVQSLTRAAASGSPQATKAPLR